MMPLEWILRGYFCNYVYNIGHFIDLTMGHSQVLVHVCTSRHIQPIGETVLRQQHLLLMSATTEKKGYTSTST